MPGVSGKSSSDRDTKTAKRPNTRRDRATQTAGHKYLYWSSLKNPAAAIEMLGYVALYFDWIGGLLGFIIFAIMIPFVSEDVVDDITYMFFFCLCWIICFHLIYKLCKTAVKKGWVKDKNNIHFNRRTGFVSFTWKGKRVSYPFDEFDVSMQHVVGYAGNVNYHLFLNHRYTSQFFRSPSGQWNQWETELDWEFYQHYMDISRPLPDVPNLEPFRKNDPVTAKWDAEHNLPQDYWLNQSIERVEEMYELAKASAETFPWGQSRKEALETGWQPSGVGEGDWRNN